MKGYTRQMIISLVFVLAVFGLAAAETPSNEQMSLPEMISSAKTQADHEEIAAYYDAAAKDAKRRAAEHAKLTQAYDSLGGGVEKKSGLAEHCTRLTQSAETDAQDYASLAEAHREMAKKAAQ